MKNKQTSNGHTMSDKIEIFEINASIAKVNEDLGLVFGFAMVCKVDGKDYYDLQGDHIPENVMLEASTRFMKNIRVAKDMHDGESIGTVIHSFPLTMEIAKSLGIETERTGLLIAMQVESSDVLNKIDNGEYTGFSIGGTGIGVNVD